MQIHNTTYGNTPTPKDKRRMRNAARHIQDGTGVAAPNPPHTPPIQRSLESLFTFLRFCQTLILPPDGFPAVPGEQPPPSLKCGKYTRQGCRGKRAEKETEHLFERKGYSKPPTRSSVKVP